MEIFVKWFLSFFLASEKKHKKQHLKKISLTNEYEYE